MTYLINVFGVSFHGSFFASSWGVFTVCCSCRYQAEVSSGDWFCPRYRSPLVWGGRHLVVLCFGLSLPAVPQAVTSHSFHVTDLNCFECPPAPTWWDRNAGWAGVGVSLPIGQLGSDRSPVS